MLSAGLPGEKAEAVAGAPSYVLSLSCQEICTQQFKFVNDPSEGSPTETLLRLLLPLDDQVRTSSRRASSETSPAAGPTSSLNHPIGSSDGRCVQRAGT